MPRIASLNFRPIAQSEGSEVQTEKFQMSGFSILHHGIYLFEITLLSHAGASSPWYKTGSITKPTGNTVSKFVLSQSAASLIPRPHTGLGLSESNPCRGLCG